MTRRCENCGRPLLRSDDKCYHCHSPVPEIEQYESETAEIELSSFIRYIIFILVLMAIGLFLMAWMGNSLF